VLARYARAAALAFLHAAGVPAAPCLGFDELWSDAHLTANAAFEVSDDALQLANEALQLFPEEANFHALRGDIRLTNELFDMAETNYDRAIARRDSFFYYYVQRGITREAQHKSNDAERDLERSIELLPTAPAHYTLGLIKKKRGQREAAIEHFSIVAKSSGKYARAAGAELARMQIAEQPGKYVSTSCDAGSNGNLIISVRNDAAISIRGVRVQLDYSDNYGNTRREIINVSDRIDAGQVARADTGIRVYEGTRCVEQVIAAQVAE